MAEIAPNSIVKVLKGVSIDKSYNHTVNYSNSSAQYTAFSLLAKYTFTEQYYQRVGKNSIKVAQLADNLYDCNYMIFQNTSYGTKWFYAFIDSVEYINDNTTRINYTIDVMQTWLYDFTIEQCFVEREHSLTDNIGDNIVPEKFTNLDYIPTQFYRLDYNMHWTIAQIPYYLVISYIPNTTSANTTIIDTSLLDWDNSWVAQQGNYDIPTKTVNSYHGHSFGELNDDGYYYGALYILAELRLYNKTRTKAYIQAILEKIISINGNVFAMFEIPYGYVTPSTNDDNPDYNVHDTFTGNMNKSFKSKLHNGTPYSSVKNNKLYSFPYKYLLLTNGEGKSQNYFWEMFPIITVSGSKTFKFNFDIKYAPPYAPEIMAIPTGYRDLTFDYDSAISITSFPPVIFNVDSFLQWWQQNKFSVLTGALSSSLNLIGGALTTGSLIGNFANIDLSARSEALNNTFAERQIINTGTGTASSILNQVSSVFQAFNTPDSINGSLTDSVLKLGQNRFTFWGYDMGITAEQAKVIDDYFSMFGYAVNQVKIPNIKASGVTLRPYWNYIKTNGAIIHPATSKGLPAEDEDIISKIFDKGITFWKRLDYVGNYSLNNAPV